MADSQRRELAVVIPVFNEEGNIRKCVEDWVKVLSSLEIDFELIIIDDGSWDRSPVVLTELKPRNEIRIITKPNEGHGPSILLGYREASETAEWVFQADSDNEISPHEFRNFWESRVGNDAVLGWRKDRHQTFIRKAVSKIAGLVTRVLFGCRVHDANIPFRLIHAETLSKIISRIPRKTFAPNIAISGALCRLELAIEELPVQFIGRENGKPSFTDIGIVLRSFRALIQIVQISRMFP